MKVNLFIPTYHRLEMTKRCLESVLPLVETSQFDVNVFIGDNNSPKEMTDWLDTLSSEQVFIFKSDKNIGKAGIINQMYIQKGYDCDVLISLDSDMIFKYDSYNFIDEMVIALVENPEFGLLSTFQENNDQHLWNGLSETKTTKHHIIKYGKFNSVAGGCIVLSNVMWKTIGGYSTHGKVYGFDDGLMMQSVHLKGAQVGVIENVKLFHPDDENEEYRAWKKENIAQRKEKGFFDEKES
jgi:hypothetical protein